jgi:hypothetical protein
MVKKTSQKLIAKVASKKAIRQNAKALGLYDGYKKTSDLIERVDIALGKKPAFKAETGSTINFKINQHAIASTTAQTL